MKWNLKNIFTIITIISSIIGITLSLTFIVLSQKLLTNLLSMQIILILYHYVLSKATLYPWENYIYFESAN